MKMGTNKEEWRAVPGYEGIYEVSNLGNVRSLDRYVNSSVPGTKYFINGKQLNPIKNNRGYLRVNLCNESGRKAKFIHKLVCLAFIPNPYNLKSINHKDENKENNSADNLEWCTDEYNANYGTRNKRVSESKKGTHYNLFPIVGKDNKTGDEIHINSVGEARIYGFSPRYVSLCLSGKQKFHKGYRWRKENGNS